VTDLYLWDSQKNDPNSDDPATKFRLFSFLASVNEVLLVRRFEQVLRVSENTKGRLWSHLHASFHGSLKHISNGQCDQNPQTAVTVWSKVTFKLLDDCLCSLESQFHPCPIYSYSYEKSEVDMSIFFFSLLGFELRAYTWNPFLWWVFFDRVSWSSWSLPPE
jgi:hypothetical protein